MTKVLEHVATNEMEQQDIEDLKEALSHMRADSPVAVALREMLAGEASIFVAEKDMSPEDAAKVLGVSRPYVRHLIDKRLLKADKKGTHFKISSHDLADYIKRHEQAMAEYAEAATTTQDEQDRRIANAASGLTKQQSAHIADMFADL
ncbi:helix-turn-helix domain-containing protein [Bifidobacterium sp. ESL0769]|uniref:helix-turn-helix domain-containing protein n=1 Tax=Bifidobacterium sp. ESL0769 TaxID=2983229 RepID=UPI0023F69443|nr:helix-turn-helix domain-containing protein [Bifidobacterium sp. ESL0769]WEV67362.1 helix-turn-helix domain-containing protein [Bifidobacterium sp. ESL0769]